MLTKSSRKSLASSFVACGLLKSKGFDQMNCSRRNKYLWLPIDIIERKTKSYNSHHLLLSTAPALFQSNGEPMKSTAKCPHPKNSL